MPPRVIRYPSPDAFHDGVLALTMRGLTFEACASSLTVTLTGGF